MQVSRDSFDTQVICEIDYYLILEFLALSIFIQ
jgi:hypothetical protein